MSKKLPVRMTSTITRRNVGLAVMRHPKITDPEAMAKLFVEKPQQRHIDRCAKFMAFPMKAVK